MVNANYFYSKDSGVEYVFENPRSNNINHLSVHSWVFYKFPRGDCRALIHGDGAMKVEPPALFGCAAEAWDYGHCNQPCEVGQLTPTILIVNVPSS